jgi:hypothetical protein
LGRGRVNTEDAERKTQRGRRGRERGKKGKGKGKRIEKHRDAIT